MCTRWGPRSDEWAKSITLVLLIVLFAGVGPARGASRLFDIDLDDRVDPVPPGGEIVYEIDIENSFPDPAPDTVIADILPPGTTFVAAYRQPDYAEIAAEVLPGEVRFHLGDEPSCGSLGLPGCRDIRAVLRVDDDVAPGTVLMNQVVMTSSDPIHFPMHMDHVFTSVGAAAIRRARVFFTNAPGRDAILIEADLGRTGLRTPLFPPTPTIDPTLGVRVVLSEPGGATGLDVTIPGADIRCRGIASRRCRLADPKIWRPLGLYRLNIFLPLLLQQRNNPQVLVRTARQLLPDDFGPELELTIESDGVSFTDMAELAWGGPKRLTYRHKQSEP